MLMFLALGMAMIYLIGRARIDGPTGVLAAMIFGSAPFVVFNTLRFQLDLPLAATVALAIWLALRSEGFTRRGWAVGPRRGDGARHADQAAVSGLRAAGGGVGTVRRARPAAWRERDAGRAGGVRDQRGVVRAPPDGLAGADREPLLQAGARSRDIPTRCRGPRCRSIP
jgi:hypothetical protein